MKKFKEEFKAFISRGNVMDLAVGMIIGAAFTAIVNSLVENIIMPLISGIFGGISFTDWAVKLGSGENAATLQFGLFIQAIIDFILIALVLFWIIKGMNKLQSVNKKEEPEEEPTTKTCPFCKSEIAIDATRCPHCTSEQPAEEAAE